MPKKNTREDQFLDEARSFAHTQHWNLAPQLILAFGWIPMIIQDLPHTIRLITQHDHGRLSGIFAQAWRDPTTGEHAHPHLIEATYLHDILWTAVDLLPRYDDAQRHFADFIAFPMDAKIEAYTYGIQQVGKVSPYAGLLHARHFSEFMSRDKYPAFRHEMDGYIAQRRQELTMAVLAHENEDLALLRLFDVMSLILCMTGPAITRTPPPWLNPSPLMTQRNVHCAWVNAHTLQFAPFCFDAPFTLSIPFREVARSEDPIQMLSDFAAAPWQSHEVQIIAS